MKASTKHDLIVLALSAIAWAVFGYWPAFHALTFWIVPPIACSTTTVLVVCGALNARPLYRPFLALIPPAIVLPYSIVLLHRGDWAGPLVAALIVYPALASAFLYLLYVLIRRVRANNSFKPKPLRGSA